MRKPLVFVLQNVTNLTFNRALKYGDVKFVLDAGLVPGDQSVMEEILREKMLGIKDDDFLIMSGDPFVIFLAGKILPTIVKGITLLRYERQRYDYNPIRMTF